MLQERQTLDELGFVKRKMNCVVGAKVGMPNLKPLILQCRLEVSFT